MKAELQRIKIKLILSNDDEFTIEYAAGRQSGAQRFEQLRKVAVERLFIPALNQDFVMIPENQCSKSVPFRLKNPIVT